jgi:hypothetical protein
MKRNLVAGVLASAFAVVSTIGASASTILSDGSFGGTIDVTSSSGSPNLTATGSVSTTVGNPANSLDARATYSAPTSAAATVIFVDHSLSYNPLVQGAISSIDASYDRELVNTGGSQTSPEIFRLLIAQDGVDYVSAVTICTGCDSGGVWNNLAATDLLASSFTAIGGSAHPNFAGDPILFGIEASLASTNSMITASNAYFDNIDITLSQTPLPAALPLFATGLGVMGWLGRRRKRKNTAAVAAA